MSWTRQLVGLATIPAFLTLLGGDLAAKKRPKCLSKRPPTLKAKAAAQGKASISGVATVPKSPSMWWTCSPILVEVIPLVDGKPVEGSTLTFTGVKASQSTKLRFQIGALARGDYRVRVAIDVNKNGRINPGDYAGYFAANAKDAVLDASDAAVVTLSRKKKRAKLRIALDRLPDETIQFPKFSIKVSVNDYPIETNDGDSEISMMFPGCKVTARALDTRPKSWSNPMREAERKAAKLEGYERTTSRGLTQGGYQIGYTRRVGDDKVVAETVSVTTIDNDVYECHMVDDKADGSGCPAACRLERYAVED